MSDNDSDGGGCFWVFVAAALLWQGCSIDDKLQQVARQLDALQRHAAQGKAHKEETRRVIDHQRLHSQAHAYQKAIQQPAWPA